MELIFKNRNFTLQFCFRRKEEDKERGDEEDEEEDDDDDNDNNKIPSGCGHYCHYISTGVTTCIVYRLFSQ